MMSMYGMHGIPLEAQYLFRRGVELSGQKRDTAAARCLRQAIIIAPRFTGAYRELANCLARLDRMEDAADCYRKLEWVGSHGTAVQVQSGA
jgi:hypothetical protein